MHALTTRCASLGALLATGFLDPASAFCSQDDSELALAEVVVVGSRINLERIPGSGSIIERSDLEAARVFTVNEALRRVPGVFARDEEGMGLRPNIGIRGLNPTRSTKVLLLEDGLPLAYAPYGDNATYYHPPVERFERIEVLKGAGQIEFGPQTIGGVINYITPAPPEDLSGSMQLAAGNHGFRELHAGVGGRTGRTGVLLSATRKVADGARENIDLGIMDLTAKLTHELTSHQQLTVRASHVVEDSQVTYSGLTLAEYQENPRGNAFANDRLTLSRFGSSITHRLDLTDRSNLTTSVYYSRFDRDWWRQSSNSGQRPNDASDPQCGGMTNLKTTCGNEGRLRQYETGGIEPRYALRTDWLGLDTELKLGARWHQEKQHRVQANGDTPDARTPGTGVNAGIREDNRRYVDAAAGFVQVAFSRDALTVVPGLRYEHMDYERVNELTGAQGTTSLSVWVPGLGATWRIAEGVTLFGGMHRGFAPPRVEDAINTSGGTVDLDAELSWNQELGVRAQFGTDVELELTAFRMRFENQIVPSSVAGGVGADLTSAGETLHQGLEALANLRYPVSPGLTLNARLAWTWLPEARFLNTRCSALVTTTCISVTGNRLPYAPENLGTLTLGLAGRSWRAQVEGVYTDAMYTDDLNTLPIAANGQRGLMPAHLVWNATVNYTARDWLEIYATVKNLGDRLHVVDMTRGLTPGNPRLMQAGIVTRF